MALALVTAVRAKLPCLEDVSRAMDFALKVDHTASEWDVVSILHYDSLENTT